MVSDAQVRLLRQKRILRVLLFVVLIIDTQVGEGWSFSA